jgi:hypothetical protein
MAADQTKREKVVRTHLSKIAPSAPWREQRRDDGSLEFFLRARRCRFAAFVEREAKDDGWHLIMLDAREDELRNGEAISEVTAEMLAGVAWEKPVS